jgi:hypothetical protein
MLALYIILGIIAFFVLLLSISVRVQTEYIDSFIVKVKWLFITYTVYPMKKKESKKPKKEKKKKEKPKTEEEKPKDENINKKKENPLKTFYENQGFDGVIKLVNSGADALGGFMKSFKKHFIIEDLDLWAVISKNHDAAGTALEYGKVCQDVFPSLGYICSNFKVKRYDISIEPDFLGTFSSAQFVFNFHLRPIFLLNAGTVMAVKLAKNVAFKVLFSMPKKESNENINNSQNIKGGATQ